MDLFTDWLLNLSPQQRVLDLGCGSGSFRYDLCACKVVALDTEFRELPASPSTERVCADGVSLPFADKAFDLVVCHHSLEHFRNVVPAIQEIRRIIRPGGKLLISVPAGCSFTDRLYRLLLAGGGHFQRFEFQQLVGLVESEAGLHLAGWKVLYSSFIYLKKRNFLPAPRGPHPGPFPRRIRWIGHLPDWLFEITRFLLNLGTRISDRYLGSNLSIYGWQFAFESFPTSAVNDPPFVNVCMYCGFAVDSSEVSRIAAFFYRCKRCDRLNALFGS